jgi:hypothetical protein
MVGVRDFSHLQNVKTNPGTHPTFCLMGTRELPGVMWQGHKVNHSPPSSAQVKKEWIYASTLPLCLHGVDREDLFTFTQ